MFVTITDPVHDLDPRHGTGSYYEYADKPPGMPLAVPAAGAFDWAKGISPWWFVAFGGVALWWFASKKKTRKNPASRAVLTTPRCTAREFSLGSKENYEGTGDARASVSREHGVYQVRGFDPDGRHANRAFRELAKARSFARNLVTGKTVERY